MKQLLLELTEPYKPSLDDFAVGQNQELVHRLAQFAARTSSDHFLYLWGEPASGKTHLLQALGAGPMARYMDGQCATPAQLNFDQRISLYLLDNCHALDSERQIDAFALFNQIREHQAFLISSGPVAPAILPIREDLRTRMGWGLIYQLHGLTDADKITTLQHTAQSRGWQLAPGIVPYLITHYRRDMRSLTLTLDALAQLSLETKRPMTLPLLRDVLRAIDPAHAPLQSDTDDHESGLI